MLVYQVVNFYREDRDGPLDEAVRPLEGALTADPSHLGALKTRGAVLRAQGNFVEAITVDQAVIAQHPGEPTAYREIGLNKLY